MENIEDGKKREQKEHMETLSERMNKLKAKGYSHDFQMTDRGMVCKETGEIFKPEDLVIRSVYRFEGESNPEDMSILYKIEAKSGTKGLFLDAYGAYGSYDGQELAEFLKQVRREEEDTDERKS